MALGFVGLSAILVAYIPSLTNIVGAHGVEIASLVAAISLIISSVASSVILDTPPGMMVDHANYINAYSQRVLQLVANIESSQPNEVEIGALNEVVHCATKNLSDVKSRWPWCH